MLVCLIARDPEMKEQRPRTEQVGSPQAKKFMSIQKTYLYLIHLPVPFVILCNNVLIVSKNAIAKASVARRSRQT